jgi:hypothetical protein
MQSNVNFCVLHGKTLKIRKHVKHVQYALGKFLTYPLCFAYDRFWKSRSCKPTGVLLLVHLLLEDRFVVKRCISALSLKSSERGLLVVTKIVKKRNLEYRYGSNVIVKFLTCFNISASRKIFTYRVRHDCSRF